MASREAVGSGCVERMDADGRARALRGQESRIDASAWEQTGRSPLIHFEIQSDTFTVRTRSGGCATGAGCKEPAR
jgi:hypothetical protein